mmetsp:Transcript_3818/g.10020  ORF Transcript_3818/g.10020 Transcript_3818/m.10020 type:complete len:185 (-) Transcript_3818:1648-2202(-)
MADQIEPKDLVTKDYPLSDKPKALEMSGIIAAQHTVGDGTSTIAHLNAKPFVGTQMVVVDGRPVIANCPLVNSFPSKEDVPLKIQLQQIQARRFRNEDVGDQGTQDPGATAHMEEDRASAASDEVKDDSSEEGSDLAGGRAHSVTVGALVRRNNLGGNQKCGAVWSQLANKRRSEVQDHHDGAR